MSDDWNGWAETVRQLGKRVDALEVAVNKIVGRPPEAPKPVESEVKIGGIGIGTWVTIATFALAPFIAFGLWLITGGT